MNSTNDLIDQPANVRANELKSKMKQVKSANTNDL